MTGERGGSSGEPRILIVAGGDYAARTGRQPTVISRCKFTLRGAEYIDACHVAFVQFERILRKRDDAEIRYEWSNVCRTGLVVEFDINWYDLWFFEQRRNAYRVGPHPFAFGRFGATPDDFELKHEYIKNEGL
jgi:hypothetical protein